MKQSDLQKKFVWVCKTFFPDWKDVGWRAELADMPVFDGLVLWEARTIKIARRLTKDQALVTLVHEAAHAVTDTRDHSTPWRDLLAEASRIAETIGRHKFARQLQREAKHEGLTDSEQQFYEWLTSWVRENPPIDFDRFAERLSEGFEISTQELLAAFPMIRRKFNEAKALLR